MKKKTQVAILLAITPMQVQSMEESNINLNGWEPEKVIEICSELTPQSKYFNFTGIQEKDKSEITQVYFNNKALIDRTKPLNLILVIEPKDGRTLKLAASSLSGLNSDKVHLEVYLQGVILDDLKYLFRNSRSIVHIGLKNVKGRFYSMTGMCYGCIHLKGIDLGKLDTSWVTNMDYAFYDCTALSKVNLNNLNTSKVRTMKEMFANCENLEDVRINQIDSSRVQNLDSTFLNCRAIDYLDLSNFDATCLQTTQKMFSGCNNLVKIALWESENNNLRDMQGMFANCSNLQELDLSKFKVNAKTTTDDFIRNCKGLTSIKYHSDSKTKMEYSQKQCEGVKYLDRKIRRDSNIDFDSWDAENFELDDGVSENDQFEDKKELGLDDDEI